MQQPPPELKSSRDLIETEAAAIATVAPDLRRGKLETRECALTPAPCHPGGHLGEVAALRSPLCVGPRLAVARARRRLLPEVAGTSAVSASSCRRLARPERKCPGGNPDGKRRRAGRCGLGQLSATRVTDKSDVPEGGERRGHSPPASRAQTGQRPWSARSASNDRQMRRASASSSSPSLRTGVGASRGSAVQGVQIRSCLCWLRHDAQLRLAVIVQQRPDDGRQVLSQHRFAIVQQRREIAEADH